VCYQDPGIIKYGGFIVRACFVALSLYGSNL